MRKGKEKQQIVLIFLILSNLCCRVKSEGNFLKNTLQNQINFINSAFSVSATREDSNSSTLFDDAYNAANLISDSIRDKGEKLFDLLLATLISEESNKAVKTIRKILQRGDHGMVDIFENYKPREIVLSILALSRLQGFYTTYYNNHKSKGEILISSTDDDDDDESPSISDIKEVDKKLILDLAHYAFLANLAYGWKVRFALYGRLSLGNLKMLKRRANINMEDVLQANWVAKTHLPAYFIVRDRKRKEIVLAIRGTFSAHDVLTDLCCRAEEFTPTIESDDDDDDEEEEINKSGSSSLRFLRSNNYVGKAHQGMLKSAREIAKMSKSIISRELALNPSYKLVLTGHSMGGGTAAVLGMIWQDTFPVRVYTFGPPCALSRKCKTTTKKKNSIIISVIHEGDPFSTLSLGHLADLSTAISKLCQDERLRNEIFIKTLSSPDHRENANGDLRTFYSLFKRLQSSSVDDHDLILYPPGELLLLTNNGNGGGYIFNNDEAVKLRRTSYKDFRFLLIQRGMFDLSRHIPNRYEIGLNKLKDTLQKKDRN
eukprot:CAMPEP_0178941150 /NCGR_PEP_ID=MMETSP0789-20121207/1230_1 /TAXON_ID=3005 /ORGANISM="Rhizosolenia setigera, Strain CCMP 1694" /LENGTH=543 /DNA_ID=CAMNT_0020620319 /DNA_START=53 /DNA_END=1684 /DNA_ORIENTATION=+